MNDKEKQEYLEEYQQAKKKGLPFYPDIIFKDAVVVFIVFLILVGLASFLGAPLEAPANPADSSYNPRPEWYFMFLFQLLKKFPPNLEVVGVVVLPTLVIILLFFLPFLDRSRKRHFSQRPVIMGVTAFAFVGIIFLTIQSYRETPPPLAEEGGDPTAALYAKNCAGCHGAMISVAQGTNLHEIIAQGKHEGMPAWNADLTTDQIDALAGFILSPGGSQLFVENCGACHETTDLISSNPIEIRNALSLGSDYPPHSEADIPDWTANLSAAEISSLQNFLIAPDGQRLFAVNCTPCHGSSVAFAGSEDELRTIISQGGLHLEMPPWQEKLDSNQVDTLARYVVNPSEVPEGQSLFQENCTVCHGEQIPQVQSVDEARSIISEGGPHQTMPVWGTILTPEQLDALVSYTYNSAKGTSLEVGQELFAANCVSCHGDFGEGGPNPTRPDDIIAPISTGEYLKTRDDATLRSIISQGQPNFGMSPFSSSFGGPLDDDQVDALVAFIRSWEANPPVELPPDITQPDAFGDTEQIYFNLCAQCHAADGSGFIGPSLIDAKFKRAFAKDEDIFDTINNGHQASAMIAWGDILSSDQIQQLVEFIRELGDQTTTTGQPTPVPSAGVSFKNDVLPIFNNKCKVCHGTLGGWDASSYETVMNTGNNAPVVIPGNSDESLLAQKILGTQSQGSIMPPGSKLPESEIQVILDWITAGAPDN